MGPAIDAKRISEIEAVARAFAAGEIDEIPDDVRRDVEACIRATRGIVESVVPALARIVETLTDAFGRIPPEVLETLRARKIEVDLEAWRGRRR